MIREKKTLPGTILAAYAQTAGRGRYDRRWLTQAGQNLTFSLFLQTKQSFPVVASAPMATGLAVAEYLHHEHGLPAQVKWPNDVMIGGKKICGILSERIEQNSGNDMVVGIGINLNMAATEAAAIEKPATSVFIETGRKTTLETELLKLIPHLTHWLTIWGEGGFPVLRKDWLALAWRLGEEVTVGDGDYRQTGILHGFGASGELLLRLPDGSLQTCWSGDFSY